MFGFYLLSADWHRKQAYGPCDQCDAQALVARVWQDEHGPETTEYAAAGHQCAKCIATWFQIKGVDNYTLQWAAGLVLADEDTTEPVLQAWEEPLNLAGRSAQLTPYAICIERRTWTAGGTMGSGTTRPTNPE